MDELLTAAVLCEDVAAETADTPLPCGSHEPLKQSLSDSLTLHLIAHRDRRFSRRRMGTQPRNSSPWTW